MEKEKKYIFHVSYLESVPFSSKDDMRKFGASPPIDIIDIKNVN